MNKARSVHNEHTRLISLKPKLIGLDNIVLSTNEANLRNNRDVIVRQPDGLMFDPSTHTLYNIEYKCNDTKSNYLHAQVQLITSSKRLKTLFPDWHITNLYVHNDYKVNVVR